MNKLFSIIFIILGVCWEAFWIYEAINFNPESIIAGQYACMVVFFIIVSPVIGLLELDYLLEPFKE